MAKLTIRRWIITGWGMFIQGGANAALATLGLAGANSMGIDVTPLNYKQTGAVFLSGAVIKLLRFLEQSPVPEFDAASDEQSNTSENKQKTTNT